MEMGDKHWCFVLLCCVWELVIDIVDKEGIEMGRAESWFVIGKDYKRDDQETEREEQEAKVTAQEHSGNHNNSQLNW